VNLRLIVLQTLQETTTRLESMQRRFSFLSELAASEITSEIQTVRYHMSSAAAQADHTI